MVDRIELQKIINQIVDIEETKSKSKDEPKRDEAVRVELSKLAKERVTLDYEDINKRVERIREALSSGKYEVSPEKIVQGIERYLSSK
ncbi:MAG: hypothetical protein D6674_06080 [Acidobacteria bacterium]|jgi:anti-sigma28 factor (negative regulator of flagellin synthesis)|nr:MAG: hypothetical protein D6674_06080 [Acidobacteriota bacterium]